MEMGMLGGVRDTQWSCDMSQALKDGRSRPDLQSRATILPRLFVRRGLRASVHVLEVRIDAGTRRAYSWFRARHGLIIHQPVLASNPNKPSAGSGTRLKGCRSRVTSGSKYLRICPLCGAEIEIKQCGHCTGNSANSSMDRPDLASNALCTCRTGRRKNAIASNSTQ